MTNNFIISDFATTYSLVMDIRNSTVKTIDFDDQKKINYYNGLFECFSNSLKDAALKTEIIKYTGDGLIISIRDKRKILNLLAFVFSIKLNFNNIMYKKITMSDWKFRFSIAAGKDMEVYFNDMKDFVGDSIRRATRIQSLCKDDYLRIDSEILNVCLEICNNNIDSEKIEINREDNIKIEKDITSISKIKLAKNSDKIIAILEPDKSNDENGYAYKFEKLSVSDRDLLKRNTDESVNMKDGFDIGNGLKLVFNN